MPERRKALGRGLSALLPQAADASQEIPTAAICPGPHQPRRGFDDEKLAELADSIRQHGVLQPVLVTPLPSPTPDGACYRLVAGERRWRAALLAGLERLPAIVRELDERESLEVALVENLQREDLNPVEEARAYHELLENFGLTQEQLAERVGKSRSAVANSLRLLKLPEAVLQLLLEDRLTEGHARALLGLPPSTDATAVASEVCRRGLSVRQTEELVRQLASESPGRSPSVRRDAHDPVVEAENESLVAALRSRLGTRVDLVRGRRGGRLVIHFYSDEELDAIFRTIGAEL
ncbi:MAG: ParB/RepB/Spo0J family partition protein [Anaerolineae bacterium]|nr:ParB/RepB/Spo0J family partition protein [Anaerolineae bacterium]